MYEVRSLECLAVRKFNCILYLLKKNVSFGEHEINWLPGSATWIYEPCTAFPSM